MTLRTGTALLAFAVLASCGPERADVAIGYALPDWGVAATRLVEADLVAAGNPLGIRLVAGAPPLNSEADGQVARAEELAASPGVVAVVGHGDSRSSLTAAAVYADAQVVQVVPTGTSRLLASAGGWTFALPANDSVQGVFMAGFAHGELGARRALILHVNDEYGDGLRTAVATAFTALGGTLLEEVVVHPDADVATLVEAALTRARPDIVFVALRAASAGAAARALSRLAPAVPIVAGDAALELPHLVDHAGGALQRFHAVAFWTAADGTAASAAFAARYREVTGEAPHAPHAMAYDALNVVIAALEAGARRPADIRRYLTELGRARPAYQGVTGPIAFGEPRVPGFTMVRFVNGEAVPITRVETQP